MTPDEEAKANRQGSLLFALGGREGLPLRAVRPMEHSCRWQLYHEKRSRDGRGTGETDCFLLDFGQFLPSSKRDLLSRQYGFAGDCTVFRLGPSLFRHGLRPRWGCCKIGFSVGAATCRPLSHGITHLILAFCSERQRAAGRRPYRKPYFATVPFILRSPAKSLPCGRSFWLYGRTKNAKRNKYLKN